VRSWVLTKEGIYFAADGNPHGTRIGYFSFSTGAVSEIAALEREPVRLSGSGHLARQPSTSVCAQRTGPRRHYAGGKLPVSFGLREFTPALHRGAML
jgi:hypothetical protein